MTSFHAQNPAQIFSINNDNNIFQSYFCEPCMSLALAWLGINCHLLHRGNKMSYHQHYFKRLFEFYIFNFLLCYEIKLYF